MTCIIGYIENDSVYIGGDSAGVSGLDISIRADKKVFKKDEMIFGFTSSFRMGQILQYNFSIPKQKENMDDFKYLCTDFIGKLIECFKNNAYATIKDNVAWGGKFLVGYRGKLYKVYSDFQVSKASTQYDACGCGEPYALGALMAFESKKMSAEIKILKALEIAAFFSAGVAKPFHIVKL